MKMVLQKIANMSRTSMYADISMRHNAKPLWNSSTFFSLTDSTKILVFETA